LLKTHGSQLTAVFPNVIYTI